jgi:LmbE family N-acetylglucosaminyl deacetylase
MAGRRLLRAVAGVLTGTVLAASSAVPAQSPAVAAPPCGRSLNVVAHEDDDLLFLNPAVSADIAAGRCVVTLFVTAGDAGRTRSYWLDRERGAMAAYARMANAADQWSQDTLVAAGHLITRRTLLNSRVQLLFLRLPDNAHKDVNLPRLWLGEIPAVQPLDSPDRYTRAGLIATLTAVMDAYQPQDVRTLDFTGAYGDGDHADHHTVGYLTATAQEAYRTPHQMSGYMGYEVADQPENLSEDVRNEKLSYFLAYAPHDRKVCQTDEECLANFYAPRFSHSVVTGTGVGAGRNLAVQARARASSANVAAGQDAAKAVDGLVTGAPARPGDEWATRGGRAGTWLSLTWPTPHRLDEIDLHDRPNTRDRVTGGLLRFSDGSVVPVGPLPDNGRAKVVRFRPRYVAGVRFEITSVSPTTRSAGLAEIRVFSVSS